VSCQPILPCGCDCNALMSRIILILHISFICFYDNAINILWKHVQFEMNLMKFEFSKTLINHCNECFTMFLLF